MVDAGKLDVLDRVGLHVPSWAVPNFPPTGLDNRGSLEVPIPGDDILLTLQGEKSSVDANFKRHGKAIHHHSQMHRAHLGHGDIEVGQDKQHNYIKPWRKASQQGVCASNQQKSIVMN